MQKCRYADLRKSTNILEHQKENSEHLENSAGEHHAGNMQKGRNTEMQKCGKPKMQKYTHLNMREQIQN